jgi:methionyl aminopeptidase
MIILKTSDQIEIMDEANRIVHHILNYAEKTTEIGMTSEKLDLLLEDELKNFNGASPAFKGYMGYPKASCISINSQVVHGMPNATTVFKEGDIISIDFGVFFNNFVGDGSKTFILGKANCEKDINLVNETKRALEEGVRQMVVGNRLHDISIAIERVAKLNGFGNIRNFCGHGIGIKMHESPSVFNYPEPKEPNIRLQEGLVLALEPMFTLGTWKTKFLDDKWTVVTIDNSNTAHWEYSVAVTKDGPRILGINNE